jgi:hypothetical protein
LGDVCGTHHQIAVELNFRKIAKFASTPTRSLARSSANMHAFGIEQSFVERRKVQALLAIATGCHVATVTNQLGAWAITQRLDPLQEVVT